MAKKPAKPVRKSPAKTKSRKPAKGSAGAKGPAHGGRKAGRRSSRSRCARRSATALLAHGSKKAAAKPSREAGRKEEGGAPPAETKLKAGKPRRKKDRRKPLKLVGKPTRQPIVAAREASEGPAGKPIAAGAPAHKAHRG
jgi:hypothetical protein